MNDRPAIEGGSPAVTLAVPAWPPRLEEVREALLASYASGDWGRYHGAATEELARRLSALHADSEVFLCSSGTVAVELALRGLQLGPGDEVLLAGYDFPGNFRAIEAVGARPVLVDLAVGNYSLDPTALLQSASPATRGVLVSHLHNTLAPLPAIRTLADQQGWKVLEDACQVPGATIAGRPAGSWSDAAVLSFGGSKLLTAGRGGAVLSRDAAVIQRIRIHAERGNSALPLSELQAAVLLPQLERLSEWNQRRAIAAKRLREELTASGTWKLLPEDTSGTPACYKLPLAYAPPPGGPDRQAVLAAFAAEGVEVGAGFRGFAKRPASRCRRQGELPRSRAASEELILLHHPLLLGEEPLLDQAARAFAKVAAWVRGE